MIKPERIIGPRARGSNGLRAVLLLLLAVGCTSGAAAAVQPSSPATQTVAPVSQAAQPTPPDTATVQPSASLTPTPAPTSLPPTDTVTPSPVPTETATPTSTATPTLTPSPTPTPSLQRLTTGGCCTQPFWSPDSKQVLFIDRPASDAPLGFWGVDATQPGSAPELVTERIAFYTDDLAYRIEFGSGETAILRLAAPLSETVAERWVVPAAGRSISISPSRTRIAWQVSNDDLPVESRVTELWVANFDGTEPQSVARLPRGGLSGWVSDDLLLVSSRESLQSQETIVYTLSLVDGATVDLIRADRPRGYALSPDRLWLVYYVTFSADPAENGLWLVRTDGTERRQLDRAFFGDYAWRDAHLLLIIPFRPDALFHELWQVDAGTGAARQLTDPALTPFKIANGDWQVSPDGRHVVFVESSDRNIWMLTLPD